MTYYSQLPESFCAAVNTFFPGGFKVNSYLRWMFIQPEMPRVEAFSSALPVLRLAGWRIQQKEC